MVRWLEREGLDVTYSTDVDTHENGASLLQHKAFLSVGHDEYWSREMRTNVEAARDQIGNPVSLGFFSANTCYWRIRFEPSTSTGASDRTIVCYRGDPDDPHANDDLATTKWELYPGRYPEASMIGVHFVYDSINSDVVIADNSHWACANTGLSNGDHLAGLLGYEIDKRDSDFSPAGTTVISQSHFANRYHNDQDDVSEMTSYTAPSGATVFATGSIQWSWGLDDYNVRNFVRISRLPPPLNDIKRAPQQITRNVLARFRNGSSAISPNPIDDARFFVRKHYHDFLNREPDSGGWDYWTNNITSCGSDAGCIEAARVNTSQAFFSSIEFQNTGYFVYRIHQVAFDTGERLLRPKFVSGSQQVGNGVIVGVGDWQGQLDQNKRAFADAFVNNPDFIAQYQQMSNSQYVDALIADTYDPQNPSSGGALTVSERDQLVDDLNQSQKTRAQVLYAVAENSTFQQRQNNKAFVLMQYFGYLRRQPNEFPDSDFVGYGFWLTDLNSNNASELIRGFIDSTEYRLRFGPRE